MYVQDFRKRAVSPSILSFSVLTQRSISKLTRSILHTAPKMAMFSVLTVVIVFRARKGLASLFRSLQLLVRVECAMLHIHLYIGSIVTLRSSRQKDEVRHSKDKMTFNVPKIRLHDP